MTNHYILSELEEKKREETFLMKRVKQNNQDEKGLDNECPTVSHSSKQKTEILSTGLVVLMNEDTFKVTEDTVSVPSENEQDKNLDKTIDSNWESTKSDKLTDVYANEISSLISQDIITKSMNDIPTDYKGLSVKVNRSLEGNSQNVVILTDNSKKIDEKCNALFATSFEDSNNDVTTNKVVESKSLHDQDGVPILNLASQKSQVAFDKVQTEHIINDNVTDSDEERDVILSQSAISKKDSKSFEFANISPIQSEISEILNGKIRIEPTKKLEGNKLGYSDVIKLVNKNKHDCEIHTKKETPLEKSNFDSTLEMNKFTTYQMPHDDWLFFDTISRQNIPTEGKISKPDAIQDEISEPSARLQLANSIKITDNHEKTNNMVIKCKGETLSLVQDFMIKPFSNNSIAVDIKSAVSFTNIKENILSLSTNYSLNNYDSQSDFSWDFSEDENLIDQTAKKAKILIKNSTALDMYNPYIMPVDNSTLVVESSATRGHNSNKVIVMDNSKMLDKKQILFTTVQNGCKVRSNDTQESTNTVLDIESSDSEDSKVLPKSVTEKHLSVEIELTNPCQKTSFAEINNIVCTKSGIDEKDLKSLEYSCNAPVVSNSGNYKGCELNEENKKEEFNWARCEYGAKSMNFVNDPTSSENNIFATSSFYVHMMNNDNNISSDRESITHKFIQPPTNSINDLKIPSVHSNYFQNKIDYLYSEHIKYYQNKLKSDKTVKTNSELLIQIDMIPTIKQLKVLDDGKCQYYMSDVKKSSAYYDLNPQFEIDGLNFSDKMKSELAVEDIIQTYKASEPMDKFLFSIDEKNINKGILSSDFTSTSTNLCNENIYSNKNTLVNTTVPTLFRETSPIIQEKCLTKGPGYNVYNQEEAEIIRNIVDEKNITKIESTAYTQNNEEAPRTSKSVVEIVGSINKLAPESHTTEHDKSIPDFTSINLDTEIIPEDKHPKYNKWWRFSPVLSKSNHAINKGKTEIVNMKKSPSIKRKSVALLEQLQNKVKRVMKSFDRTSSAGSGRNSNAVLDLNDSSEIERKSNSSSYDFEKDDDYLKYKEDKTPKSKHSLRSQILIINKAKSFSDKSTCVMKKEKID